MPQDPLKFCDLSTAEYLDLFSNTGLVLSSGVENRQKLMDSQSLRTSFFFIQSSLCQSSMGTAASVISLVQSSGLQPCRRAPRTDSARNWLTFAKNMKFWRSPELNPASVISEWAFLRSHPLLSIPQWSSRLTFLNNDFL